MPYQLLWLVEGRVIQVVFSGETTVVELQKFVRAIKGHLDDAASPMVHIVADADHLEKFPVNIGLLNMLLSDMLRHPKLDWGIFISSSGFTRFVASTVMEIGRIHFRVFATRQEGLTYLNQADATLPDLLALSQHLHE